MSFISNALGISNGYQTMGNDAFNFDILNSSTDLRNTQARYGDLIKQLQAQGNGQGPDLAGQQLANATGNNVAAQNSLMAGQRGSGANVGLIARQAAQQGANTQQQAVGQGAALTLQQQLAAREQLGQALQGSGGIAANQYGAVAGALTNNSRTSAQVAQNNTNQNAGIASGVINGIGSMMSMLAKGGPVKHMFQGGDMLSNYSSNAIDPGLANGPSAEANNLFGATSKGSAPKSGGSGGGGGSSGGGGLLSGLLSSLGGGEGGGDSGDAASGAASLFANGGSTPTQAPQMPNWAQNFLSFNSATPSISHMARGGGMHFAPANMEGGGHVQAQAPAQRAVKPGNSYSNDKIPAVLSEGEVVLPRSVTQSADPVKSAANFMAQILAGKHRKGK